MNASHLYDIELVRGRRLAAVGPRITAAAAANGFYPENMSLHGRLCAQTAALPDAMLSMIDSLTMWVVASARGTGEFCGFANGSKQDRARFRLGYLYVTPGHNKTIVEKFILEKVQREMASMGCSELFYECEMDTETIRRMFAHKFRLRTPPLVSLEEDPSLPSLDYMVWATEHMLRILPEFRHLNQNTERLGAIIDREKKAAALATEFLLSADEPDLNEFARVYDRYVTAPKPLEHLPALLCLVIPRVIIE